MSKLAALALAVLLSQPVAFADDSLYQQGVSAFGKKDYKAACDCFERAIKQTPDNANAYYYSALSYHHLGNFTRAQERYREIVSMFPTSEAARLSSSALKGLTTNYARNQAQQTASAQKLLDTLGTHLEAAMDEPFNKVDLSQAPQKCKIYYKPLSGGHFLVQTQVNNRPLEMMFDTGASTTVVGKNHLRAIGVAPPPANARPSGFGTGVGASAPIPFYTMFVNFKVGDIRIPNFPLTVMEYLPTEPLLGQNFFKHFAYTIDYGANSIALTRKDAYNASAQQGYSVPFTREGNELLVNVEVNGKPYPMYFDTGASGVAFTLNDMKKLNIEIPDDAHMGMSTGIGGATPTAFFPIRRLRLGPIEKNDLVVGVTMQTGISRPLLGQSFYSGWQYTIDNTNNTIKFVRR